MAIFHMNCGMVSRSSGRSSVQSAAYITGEKLSESRRGIVANYQNRVDNVAAFNTLIPDHGERSFADLSVWDKLEEYEDKYAIKRFPNDLNAREKFKDNAQTAMTVVCALPRELSLSVSTEMVEDFAKERFVSRDLIVTYAIHKNEGNPHVHYQISRRRLEEDNTFSWAKDRDICLKSSLLETRKLWADTVNSYLEREGFDLKISEKSFLDLGIKLEPEKHRGWVSDKLADMGIDSRIVSENRDTFNRNRGRIIENPEIILEELTVKNATFTQNSLLKLIQKRVGDDDKVIAAVFEKTLLNSIFVGHNKHSQTLYTSNGYKALEDKTYASLNQMRRTQVEQSDYGLSVALDTHLSSEKPDFTFSDNQQAAMKGLLKPHQLSTLIGRAGSGKTSILKPVCAAYQAQNHTVIGGSLAALAAAQLGKETGIKSRTLHAWLYIWREYARAEQSFLSFNSVMEHGLFKQLGWYQTLQRLAPYQLSKKHVFVLDEAGMVGTEQWSEMLHFVQKAGAKLIAVGDDHQFKAIDAGDLFRRVCHDTKENDACDTLDAIIRQKTPWMREASSHFAELNVYDGLALYENNGHVHNLHKDGFYEKIATDYIERIRTHKTGMVLAYTNNETNLLNDAIRAQLKVAGLLPTEDRITINGRSFAIGDKVVFLKNDKSAVTTYDQHGERIKGEGVLNGAVKLLRLIDDQGHLHFVSTSGKTIVVNPKTYDYLNHAYALTTHKAQGQTLDFALVAASKYMDAKGLYVAMTRHREDVQLYYKQDDFKTFKALTHHMATYDHKDLVSDYTIEAQHQAPHARVQQYQSLVQDAVCVLKDRGDHDQPNWGLYNKIRHEQQTVAGEILADFQSHQLYVQQAGLTKDMLEIKSGKRDRPLSLSEQHAEKTVELYKTYTHLMDSGYGTYIISSERWYLGKEILKNYAIHREFMNKHRVHKKHVESLYVSFQLKEIVPEHQKLVEKPFDYQIHIHTVKENLNDHIGDLAIEFLGKPERHLTKEWRYGKKGAICIHVAGSKKGLYANFETGEHGGALKLIQDNLGLEHKDAFKWGSDWLKDRGHDIGLDQHQNNTALTKAVKPALLKEEKERTTEAPSYKALPEDTPFPDVENHPSLRYMLKGRHITGTYTYRDQAHQIIGHVVRLEDKEGNKITPTLTYQKSSESSDAKTIQEEWKWKGFGDNRPLYGLEKLNQHAQSKEDHVDKPILLVEGEKTADKAQDLFPDHHVLTWSGGSGAIKKSDWSILKDKDITIWPDHDKAGINAANKIASILKDNHQTTPKIVDLDPSLPEKWDLADHIPKHLDIHKEISDAREYGQDVIRYEVSYNNIRKMATGLGYETTSNEPRAQTKLINTLFNVNMKLNPQSTPSDNLLQAVDIGFCMHECHNIKDYNFDDAYKAAYRARAQSKENARDMMKDLYKNYDTPEAQKELEPFFKEQPIKEHMESVFKEMDTYKKHFDKAIVKKVKSQTEKLLEKQKEEILFDKKAIKEAAKTLNMSMNEGYEHLDVTLINTLFRSYATMHPHLNHHECLEYATGVGLFMNQHHIQNGHISFDEKDLTASYKIGLYAHTRNHDLGEHGAFNMAMKLHNAGELDAHLNGHFGHVDPITRESHNSDHNIDTHLQHIQDHFKQNEHHMQQQIQTHQKEIDQHQHQIDMHLSRGMGGIEM